MKKLITLTAILLTASFANAQKCKYITTRAATPYDVDKKEVEIFITKTPDTSQYIEVGYIVCKCNKDNKTFKKAKKMAAKNGADAIILYEEKQRSGWDKASNTLLGTNHKDKTKFIAIRKR